MPKLFSFPFSTLSFAETIRKINHLAEKKMGSYVCVVNVHMTVEAVKNPSFGNVLRESDLAILDGMPLCWAYQLIYGFKPDRIAGKQLMHAFLVDASLRNIHTTILKYCGKGLQISNRISKNDHEIEMQNKRSKSLNKILIIKK